MRALALGLLLTVIATPVIAQNQDPILALPDGEVMLNISATERREVEQDLLVANLSYVKKRKRGQSQYRRVPSI